MQTITVDILNENALNLLKDLETLKVIKLRGVKDESDAGSRDAIKSYKGLMSKQPIEEIERQLKDLRNEWD
ncbi:hypothetical protein ACPPVU_06080 [Mucilaginibacter sp. McL0603]|uniref:hypothetical protein n=1 Tax=Mucilaginibacter sp. McL0603 TaxID=3415670 RepID=UPI003CF421D9